VIFLATRRQAVPNLRCILWIATLVAEATDGKDPELVIAALLHDAIGDQEVPRTVIAETFGEDIAGLVEEVTDDKSLEKQERKRRQIEHAPKKSDRAKILKLAEPAICGLSQQARLLIGPSNAGSTTLNGRARLQGG
jgi:(p)ppGpp synthase/HD superfamily hydrolase